ncbi:MAG: hypothetical protein MJZ86_00040 [Bacteroidales bacterium]|nr:hypothetical protein [Bacteroidales bacterium]
MKSFVVFSSKDLVETGKTGQKDLVGIGKNGQKNLVGIGKNGQKNLVETEKSSNFANKFRHNERTKVYI